MNIPDMTIEMKQGLRSENAVPAKAMHKPPAQGDDAPRTDAVNAQGRTGSDKQDAGRTREELDTLIKETEKHLEASDVKLKFNVLQDEDTIQVEILDSDGKTIRKIPEDDLLKLTKSLKNLGKGFLDETS